MCGRGVRPRGPPHQAYNFKVTYDADDVGEHMLSAAEYVRNVVATAADAPDTWAPMAACKPAPG